MVSEMPKICKCVEPLFLALAAAEALEHNAIVSRESQRIGYDVKHLVSEEDFDELVFEHNWLETSIIEPIAELAIAISLRNIKDECGIETDELRKMTIEGCEATRARKFDMAQQRFVDIKSKLLEIAKKLCGE